MPGKPKLLIVEDERDYRELLEGILRKAGYAVVSAHNGAQALERLASERPALILLDLNLPDTDGYALCRRIRGDAEFGRIPIIMVTVQSDTSSIAQGLRLGADDYVAKPFDPEEVAARVSSLLKQAA
ncbi:MAG: response regulator [Elusimicrobia bacterium]|nr:response regulator [Elusimicrobiota bacterium]